MQLFLHKSLIHSLLYTEYTFCMTLCPPDARVVAKTACALMGKVPVLVLTVLLQKNCRLVKEPAAFQGSLPRTISPRPPCIFELSLKTFASEAFCLFTEFLHGTSLILTHRPDGSSQKTWLTHTTPGT